MSRRFAIKRSLTLGFACATVGFSATVFATPLLNAPCVERVLQIATTPEELDEAVYAAWERVLNYLLGIQMKSEESAQMRRLLAKEWERGDDATRRKILSLGEIVEQLTEIPERKRSLSRQSLVLSLLLAQDKAAKEGDAFAQFQLDLYRAAHPPILPTVPFVSAEIADAFVDAYVFASEVKSGKSAPAIRKEERAKLRKGVASDFAKMSETQRQKFIDQMVKVTGFRMHWQEMPIYERLMVRSEMGVKLSPQERSHLAQVRQMLNQHQLRMMGSALNHMQANQQTIMGSAPYFNHSTQRWERIGGIQTEFH